MRGFAAELSGARDWMKVATAWLVGESGINPYTCTKKNRQEFNMYLFHGQEPNTETTQEKKKRAEIWHLE